MKVRVVIEMDYEPSRYLTDIDGYTLTDKWLSDFDIEYLVSEQGAKAEVTPIQGQEDQAAA